jgi:hypothetical protein
MTQTIRSLFSDYFKTANLPYAGLYIHAGVDLPSSGNTGFNLDGEPTQCGYMEQYNDGDEWEEGFVPTHYSLKVVAKICGNAVSGLYSEIMKTHLHEHSCFSTYPDCTLVIPEGHQWDTCIRDKFKLLDDGLSIRLIVEGYKVINRPDLMPKGVIVTDAVCQAIKALDKIED